MAADDPELEFELFEVELMLPLPWMAVVLVWIESPSRVPSSREEKLVFSSDEGDCHEKCTDPATKRFNSLWSKCSIWKPNFKWLTTNEANKFHASAAIGQTELNLLGVDGNGTLTKGVGEGLGDGEALIELMSSPGSKNLLSNPGLDGL